MLRAYRKGKSTRHSKDAAGPGNCYHNSTRERKQFFRSFKKAYRQMLKQQLRKELQLLNVD